MSTTATLAPSRLRVEPGTEAVVTVQIRNTGEIVEGYHIDVVGVPKAWASVTPPDIDGLLPGTSATVTVTFRPPRSSTVPAGDHDFGVQVIPALEPAGAVVPEGVVEVLPFQDITAELTPRISHGRRSAIHRVAVDNRGNVPLTLDLSGGDANEKLDIELKPERITVEPGQAGFAEAHVRPWHRIWRGPDLTHAFLVTGAAEDGGQLTLDGTFVQRAMLPRWLLKALLIALAILALLLALWFLVFKPAVESAAKAAVEEPVQQAQEAAGSAQTSAQEAETAAAGAGTAATAAGESLAQTNEVVQGFAPPAEIVAPESARLRVATKEGATSSPVAYKVADDATFRLTDLVASNPQGDFGRVVIALGDNVLFDLALENFRDLDLHFQSPIVAAGGESITMTVTCRDAGAPPAQTPPPTACDTALFLGGTLTTPTPAP